MRNHELINLYQSLDKLKLLEGVEFAYFMAKTKQKVRLEMENIDKAQEPSEDFKRFERSEEHTSELQSHSFISYAVFCLKKKKKIKYYFLSLGYI